MVRAKLVAIMVTAWLVSVLDAPSFGADAGGKPEKPDVIVSYAQPSGAFTPIWVAYEAGLFKKYGLNATLQLLTPQVSAQAVVSEEVDFYTDGPDLINARLRGGQVKYFGGTMQQLVFEIWAAKEFKTIQELKGKTVAASTPRAALDTATREALKKRPGAGQGRANSLRPDRAGDSQRHHRRQDCGRHALGAEHAESEGVGAEPFGRYRQARIFPPSRSPTAPRKSISRTIRTMFTRFLRRLPKALCCRARIAPIAKKAIAKYAKIEDGPTIDGTYEAFAPYWAMSLGVRPEAIKGQFEYLDEKEFPNAKSADPRDFYDNTFVAALSKSGFLKNLGMR